VLAEITGNTYKMRTTLECLKPKGNIIEAIFRKGLYKYGFYLVVLAPGVPALRAPEEPHLALVCSPELAEPPYCEIVLALGALDLDGGHGLYFIILIIHDHNLVLAPVYHARHLVSIVDLPDISAFPALQLACRRY
jgi:hypothetical protein